MKILQVYTRSLNKRGGVERYIAGLSNSLVKKGHTIKVITLNRHVFLEDYTQLGLISTILFEKFDIIHTHGFRVPFSSISGLFRKIRGDKIVMTVHTIFPERSTIDTLQKKIYDRTLGNIALRTFDKFIAITGSLAKSLADRGVPPDRIRIIPNSIDAEKFDKPPPARLFLEDVGVPTEKDVILMVGRVDWQKSLAKSIKLFSEIRKKRKNVMLVIIGKDYGFRHHLEELAKKLDVSSDVVFAGQVSEEVLHSAYSCAKVLLITSIYEGLPTVLLEAMANGLPVVSIYICGVTEMIENYDGVIWCRGAKEVSSNISSILSDDDLRRLLSVKAKETVRRDFNWAKNVDKILETYT